MFLWWQIWSKCKCEALKNSIICITCLELVCNVISKDIYSSIHTHYGDVIMGAITSQITSPSIVNSTVYSDADQRKHQSSASMASNGGNVSIWWRHHDLKYPDYQERCVLILCVLFDYIHVNITCVCHSSFNRDSILCYFDNYSKI